MRQSDCQWTLGPEMLDQARRVIDRAMANTEIPETPELHGFSRWALQEARRLRALDDDSQDALCRPGAVAFHLNSGERWVVAHLLGGDYLLVRSPRGNERRVSREYWLGDAWADR